MRNPTDDASIVVPSVINEMQRKQKNLYEQY